MPESKKKSPLTRLFISIIGTISSIILLIIGVCVFIKIKYDINIIDTIAEIRELKTEVNVNEKFTKQFSNQDMLSAQTKVNTCLSNLITYSETDGYQLNEEATGSLGGEIRLSSKEVGAIANMLLTRDGTSSFKIGNKDLNFALIQIAFENQIENSVDINVVIKIDVTSIKEGFTKFPLKMLKRYIPNEWYISSTLTVTHGTADFVYTTESKSLSINNLSEKDTLDLLTTINTFIKFGSVEDLNKTIAGSFADLLIGDATHNGFAYSLRDVGASDYDFVKYGESIYFVIER